MIEIDGNYFDATVAANMDNGNVEITFADVCPFTVGQVFEVRSGDAVYKHREVTAVNDKTITMTLIPANSVERQLRADVDFLTMQSEFQDEDNLQNRADIDYCLMMLDNEGEEINEETDVQNT